MAITGTTYGVLISTLKDLCLSNKAVKSVRVGPISSIEIPTADSVQTDQNSFNYPYIHFVPSTATLNGRQTDFGFSMIVMDLAKDDLDLEAKVQSQCLEIGRDIIAKFKMTSWTTFRYDMILPINAVPFTENFQNSVSGWTFEIKITAVTPLDLCSAPFN